jgi:hypothetical protein
MYLSKPRLATLALAFAVVFGGLGAGAAVAYQGHMHAANMYLGNALNNLEQATPDKAGHRLNAISLVKNAMSQVNMGIRAGAQ